MPKSHAFILGLTGGIGSGKSTVATLFEEENVPVYNSDNRAKWLMVNDLDLIAEIKKLFGEQAYLNKKLNRKYIAEKIFSDKDLLNALNKLVHPAVFRDFENWKKENANQELLIKEAAILFESGSYKDCDAVLLVSAEKEIRIDRVVVRDSVSREQVLDRMKNQWTEEQRLEKADYVINNNGNLDDLKLEFRKIFTSRFWLTN